MPNWADVCYKCVGDLKEVRSLNNAIKKNAKRKIQESRMALVRYGLDVLSINSAVIGRNTPAVER